MTVEFMFKKINFVLITFCLATACSSSERNIENVSLAQQSSFLKLKDSYTVLASSNDNSYLASVSDRIVNAFPESDTRLDPEISILASSEPIAVAGPYGQVLLSTEFLKALSSESQFVFVLCHELAHSYLQHSLRAKNYDHGQLSEFHHSAELEADEMATKTMIAAGYNPSQAALAIASAYRLRGIEPDPRTHPKFAERVFTIQRSTTNSGWLVPGITDSRSYLKFKSMLRR